MPGSAKPTNLLRLEGRGHRTKAELEYRERGEQALAVEGEILESAQVREDKDAHREFLRLKRLYAGIEFVGPLDQQALNMYCLEVADVGRAREELARLRGEQRQADTREERETLGSEIRRASVALYKSKELLLKYEDRLFLNPAARIRAVPKTPPKEEKTGGIAAYRARRADG